MGQRWWVEVENLNKKTKNHDGVEDDDSNVVADEGVRSICHCQLFAIAHMTLYAVSFNRPVKWQICYFWRILKK